MKNENHLNSKEAFLYIFGTILTINIDVLAVQCVFKQHSKKGNEILMQIINLFMYCYWNIKFYDEKSVFCNNII